MGSIRTLPANLKPVDLEVSPSLTIQGTTTPVNIHNFLGLKYASISARFRQAIPTAPLSQQTGIIDATAYGPRCSQWVLPELDAVRDGFGRFQPPSSLPDSDLDCCVVNVYVPPGILKSPSEGQIDLLPVLVWIHGGALSLGDGNSMADGNSLVRHAVDSGKPFVFVAFNYRLGLFGFLSSNELVAEARAKGEDGYRCLGFHDQRLALQWIRQNIHHFGGDPTKVTVAGESAGGLSTMVHTKTELPLFNRAIIMSPPSWPFQSIEKAQEKFDSYVLRCGLQLCDSPEAKIAALRNASVQQMVALLGHPAVSATYDQQFFSGKENQGLTCEQIETSRWIEKITIGWTKDEIALWSLGWRKLSTAEIISLIRNTIPEDESSFAEEILAVYGFSESMEKESALAGLIQLGTDSLFTSPPLITARHATCPVSVYRFDQVDENTDPNNKLQGLSYHGLDCNFFFRRSSAVGPKASTTERQTADTIAEMVMDMVYGQDPWAPISPTVAVTAFQPMIINGGLRGPREVEDISRVYQLTTSQEKHSMFTAIGHKLVAGASIFE